LTSLGTTLSEFFDSNEEEKIVFSESEHFEKDNGDNKITWLVPTSQKNEMEPIMCELQKGAIMSDLPHEGEEFGFVLEGTIKVTVGRNFSLCKKGESFYYRSSKSHSIQNVGEGRATIVWVSCPPNF